MLRERDRGQMVDPRRQPQTDLGARRVQLLAIRNHVLNLRAGYVQGLFVVFLVLVPRRPVRICELVSDSLAREASCAGTRHNRNVRARRCALLRTQTNAFEAAIVTRAGYMILPTFHAHQRLHSARSRRHTVARTGRLLLCSSHALL